MSGYVIGGLHYDVFLLLMFKLWLFMCMVLETQLPEKLQEEHMESKISKCTYFNKDSGNHVLQA